MGKVINFPDTAGQTTEREPAERYLLMTLDNLPAGVKRILNIYPGMVDLIQILDAAPTGEMTAVEINKKLNIDTNLLTSYLRRLKVKGVLNNTRLRYSNASKWWIVPGIRSNLSVFVNSVRSAE